MTTITTFTFGHCGEIIAELPRRRCAVGDCRARPTVAIGGMAVCLYHVDRLGMRVAALERETAALSRGQQGAAQ